MATTIDDVGVSVGVTFNINTDFSTDAISNGNNGAAIASEMPTWNYSVGHDTTSTDNCDFTAHGDASIAGSSTLTIDFSTAKADDGEVIGTGAKIKHAVFMIISPDDTAKLRLTRANNAAAVPFGLSPLATGYVEFYRHHLFCEPVVGSTGDVMCVSNPTGSTIQLAWACAGDSSTRT